MVVSPLGQEEQDNRQDAFDMKFPITIDNTGHDMDNEWEGNI